MANAQADHRGQGVRRAGIVVDDQPAARARAARHHPARHRERSLGLRFGSAPHVGVEGLALLVEEIGEAAPVEQPARPLHDQAEETVEVELGAEIPLHGGERLELLAARCFEGEEARLLERDGGLVGKVLKAPDLVHAEGASRHVADREHARDPAADRQRHREHRAVPGLLDQRAGLGREGEAGVGQDIGRRDRAALGHREAGERFVPRDPRARGKRAARAGGGDRHQTARGVLQLPQHGHRPAEQRADALGDVPADALGVERLHAGPAHRRERRRVAPGRLLAREHVRLIALVRAPLGEIAEHEHHTHRVAGAVSDGIRAAVDGDLVPAPPRQQGGRGQRRRLILPQHARGRALDGRPGLLAHDAEDGRERARARLVRGPPGEMLRRRVHERDAPAPVRDDDRVPDARERDRHLLPLRARAVLGAAAAGGQHVDGPGHQHEEEEADDVVAVRRRDEGNVRHDGERGGQEARAEAAVPGADDHRGQEQEELRSLGQRHREVGTREREADRHHGGAVRLSRLHRAKDKHAE